MGFTLPSLPSLPSIRTLLDSEPQVLYPPSATNTPAPSPSKPKKVLPPVPDDWAEERGRRCSISTTSLTGHGLGAGLGTGTGAKRPGHRRAHSALPLSHPPARPQPTTTPHAQNQPFPLGRLTEYSRNPASSSALSLPTLEEFEVEGENYTGTRGEGREAKRRASRTSFHSNYSVGSSLPPSPRRPICSLPNPVLVPPPIPRPGVTATKMTRPSLSPRCWSVMDVRSTSSSSSSSSDDGSTQSSNEVGPVTGKKGLTRHSSYLNTHTRQSVPVVARPKLSAVSERRMSSSQVSDVAVLASWHFPDQDSSTGTGSSTNTNTDIHQSKGRGNHITSSGTSKDLSDRLRSLAAIDTSPGAIVAESPLGSTTLVPRPGPQGFRPELKHRYTHSSPNLNINQSFPGGGNGPTHRRGLRQPTPLGQTSISNSISISNLSSSPGSLLSDSTSNIGPPSPVDSVVSLPAQEGKWYDLGSKARKWSRSRRGSVVSVTTGPAGAGKKDGGGEEDGLRLNVGIQLRPEDESDEEEDYIDYDGM